MRRHDGTGGVRGAVVLPKFVERVTGEVGCWQDTQWSANLADGLSTFASRPIWVISSNLREAVITGNDMSSLSELVRYHGISLFAF